MYRRVASQDTDSVSWAPVELPSQTPQGAVSPVLDEFALVDAAMQGNTTRSTGAIRILVADDDAWIRDLLTHVLLMSRYEVNAVPSAEEALLALRASRYDLLISDMKMGGMSGLDLIVHVAHTYPNLPVVLITAHGCADLMRVALRQGACDFIAKPFNIETIPLIIERNLERRNLEMQKVVEHDNRFMFKTIQALAAAIDAKEPYTAQHSRRVTALSVAMAERMQLPVEEIRVLELASHVHDVGKIGTPDSILKKPGRLDVEEWEAMRQHPAQGAEIVGRVEELRYVADVIRHHHEWINGAGYPDGLKDESIPFLSRVISVADAFEVMTSDRVYKRRLPSEEAMRRLGDGAGVQFDKRIVEAFSAMPIESLLLQ